MPTTACTDHANEKLQLQHFVGPKCELPSLGVHNPLLPPEHVSACVSACVCMCTCISPPARPSPAHGGWQRCGLARLTVEHTAVALVAWAALTQNPTVQVHQLQTHSESQHRLKEEQTGGLIPDMRRKFPTARNSHYQVLYNETKSCFATKSYFLV